jgi:hypothetical protein
MTVTLSDSATFWASIATLWGAAAAWATFFAAVWRSRDERYAALCATLSGLKAELDVVSDWAGGAEGSRGYEQLQATEDQVRDWSNPTRQIFSFECPIIHNLTNSPYISELGPIAADVVRLSRSITRIFNYYGEYRTFVNIRPVFYDAVFAKLTSRVDKSDLTLDERWYITQIFEFNRQIHQGLIGGVDSPDSLCLYKTFRTARESVAKLLGHLRKPPFPRWYWLLHAVAAAALVKGLVLSLVWLGAIR